MLLAKRNKPAKLCSSQLFPMQEFSTKLIIIYFSAILLTCQTYTDKKPKNLTQYLQKE